MRGLIVVCLEYPGAIPHFGVRTVSPKHVTDLRTAQDLSRYFRDEVVRVAEVQYEAR